MIQLEGDLILANEDKNSLLIFFELLMKVASHLSLIYIYDLKKNN